MTVNAPNSSCIDPDCSCSLSEVVKMSMNHREERIGKEICMGMYLESTGKEGKFGSLVSGKSACTVSTTTTTTTTRSTVGTTDSVSISGSCMVGEDGEEGGLPAKTMWIRPPLRRSDHAAVYPGSKMSLIVVASCHGDDDDDSSHTMSTLDDYDGHDTDEFAEEDYDDGDADNVDSEVEFYFANTTAHLIRHAEGTNELVAQANIAAQHQQLTQRRYGQGEHEQEPAWWTSWLGSCLPIGVVQVLLG